jgi:hypothetical protein
MTVQERANWGSAPLEVAVFSGPSPQGPRLPPQGTVFVYPSIGSPVVLVFPDNRTPERIPAGDQVI